MFENDLVELLLQRVSLAVLLTRWPGLSKKHTQELT